MKFLLTAFVCLVLALPSAVRAQDKEAAMAKDFVKKIQTMIKNNQVEALAMVMDYPITIYDEEALEVAADEAAFIKNYATIFTPFLKECVLGQDMTEEMEAVRGRYSVGNDDCLWIMGDSPEDMLIISVRKRKAD